MDVRVYVSDEFTDAERTNIIAGVALWERATRGRIITHVLTYDLSTETNVGTGVDGVEERAVLFRRASSGDEWVKDWDENHKQKILLGLCQGDSMRETAWLWLVEDRLVSSRSQVMIAAHEFGHAIGLKHVNDNRSVMSEFYAPSVNCLTVHDIEEFCLKHNCDVDDITVTCTAS